MEQRLKNRLVGASVIVALVVIVVPEYFEDSTIIEDLSKIEKITEDEFSSKIIPIEDDVVSIDADSDPIQQDYLTISVSEEVSNDSTEPAPELTVVAGDSEENEIVTQPVPLLKPSSFDGQLTEVTQELEIPIPIVRPVTISAPESQIVGMAAWVVQLGSFAVGVNALTLRDELRTLGYYSFVQTRVAKAGLVTRVYVGPELLKEQAETLQMRLMGDTKLQAMVVQYPGGL